MSFRFNGRGFLQSTGKNMAVSQGFTAQPISNISGLGSTITINGGGISALTTSQLSSLNTVSFKWREENVTRYEIVESKKDILELSVAWKRYREETAKIMPLSAVNSMLDDSLFDYVNDADAEYAEKIRDYYQKKFTVLALKNIELSPFRKELKEIINTDGKKFKESIVPIAYRMPEFYEYDVEFEQLLFNHNRELKGFGDEIAVHTTKQLSLIRTFMVNSKKSKRKEYWFADEDDNLVTYFVENSNPLRGLMDKFVTTDISVTATFKKRERDGYEFIKMHSIDFG